MSIPTSMGLHKLELSKGNRNDIVDWSAPLDQTDPLSVAAAYAGRVMTLNSSGNFIAGVVIGAMPFYAWSGTDINNYPDVERDRGMANAGTPAFVCWSWRAAAAMTTTEIAPDIIASPPAIGTALTAKATTCSTASQRGMFTLTKAGSNLVVAYVGPRGLYVGPDGYNTLEFYPAYVPGTTVDAT